MRRGQPLDHNETLLTGKLAEFRTALRQEIEAAQRNEASSAIPLINGRRIAQIGGSYQYAFEVENLLNLPGDVPGDLYVPSYPPQEIIVVSVDGMTVTLSVPQNLGKTVPIARLQSNLAHLMRKLIERIEGLAARSNPVGDRILGDTPTTGVPVPLSDFREWNKARKGNTRLNGQQLSAVASSLGCNTTFIWGPPGTGKTQTIGAIGEHLHRSERSVLLVSHTNTAVDQAILRIVETIDPTELATGKVLRVGDPHDKRFEGERYQDVLLKTHVDRRSAELAARRDTCEARKKEASTEVLRLTGLVDIIEWIGEAERDISKFSAEANEIGRIESDLSRLAAARDAMGADDSQWSDRVSDANVTMRQIEQIGHLDTRIAEVQEYARPIRASFVSLARELDEAQLLLAQTESANRLTRRWRGLPLPRVQQAVVRKLATQYESVVKEVAITDEVLGELNGKRGLAASAVEDFQKEYRDDPDGVLRGYADYLRYRKDLESRAELLQRQIAQRKDVFQNALAQKLVILREWNLSDCEATDIYGAFRAIRLARDKAELQVAGLSLSSLRTKRNDLNASIIALDAELHVIEDALKRIEELVIADANVIATTLTRAYLRDSIQSRRFDTLILDEASMAPIPAIWVAASTATNNAVVVGDFRQLPPIVISEDKLAKQWLGRDIFEVAGLNEREDPTNLRVDLLVQHRMHPEISVIPNTLVYEGKLRDAPNMDSNGEKDLAKWYKYDWGHDHPVLLVDTGSVGAWVTSVSRGSRASRLNFLSATISVDLAGTLLREDRDELSDGARRRILIACPYRPHAQLLELLIREEHLTSDVLAGTAHSFQGSEADVIILDLVNDEPHWRVGMFVPSYDETYRRLLNVALTRARRRLIVIGDFDYILGQAKRAFLGRDLVPFLLSRYPRIDAKDVVPVGLAARAARAQNTTTGGMVEADSERLVVTQERFYPVLQGDLAKAKERIVIYSAFITTDRLGQLAPQLRAAVERGIRVYVVTKARSDRARREITNYKRLERALADWGITVIHKRRMHEKLIFVDDDITWVGSLNPLSFKNTQEIMERRHSRKVAADYAQAILLKELLEAYAKGSPACPICGNEVVASEGVKDPFYWACVEQDCYSRSVVQPPLTDGLIVCSNCGGPVVFGNWGGKPVWRCQDNPRHRQRIGRTHLRLPKMRALVPMVALKKLEKLFTVPETESVRMEPSVKQQTLFDL